MSTNFVATSNQKINLALAYIASAGEKVVHASPQQVSDLLALSLQDSPATQDLFDVVWGPATYRPEISKLDANMMYVVQSRQNPLDYRIVIRATNAKNAYDWIVEDGAVFQKTVPWTKYDTKAPSAAKISYGTSIGLDHLLAMEVQAGLPGQGTGLVEFIRNLAQAYGAIQLTVCGHSLAGALSASLGLYLYGMLENLQNNAVQLQIQASAGPTAGNAQFASYLNSKLGNRLNRIYNPLDIVPLAWQPSSLREIPTLYGSDIKPSAQFAALVKLVSDAVSIHHYTQLEPATLLDAASVNPDYPSFAKQAAYQHVTAYALLFGMSASDIKVYQCEPSANTIDIPV